MLLASCAGGQPSPRRPPKEFSTLGKFDPDNFDSLMDKYAKEYQPQDGIIIVELYQETLVALINEPDISVLERFESDKSITEHWPLQVTLAGPFVYPGTSHAFHSSRAGSYTLVGRGFRSEVSILTFRHYIFDLSSTENIEGFLQENGVKTTVRERHLLLFDDRYFRYAPSKFLWVYTDHGPFFIFISYPLIGTGLPFIGTVVPDGTAPPILTLYTPDEFRDNWQDLMRRLTRRAWFDIL